MGSWQSSSCLSRCYPENPSGSEGCRNPRDTSQPWTKSCNESDDIRPPSYLYGTLSSQSIYAAPSSIPGYPHEADGFRVPFIRKERGPSAFRREPDLRCPMHIRFLGFFFVLFFVFCLFALSGAAPAAYGGSQPRGRIGAAAAGLCQSHSTTGSEPRL